MGDLVVFSDEDKHSCTKTENGLLVAVLFYFEPKKAIKSNFGALGVLTMGIGDCNNEMVNNGNSFAGKLSIAIETAIQNKLSEI